MNENNILYKIRKIFRHYMWRNPAYKKYVLNKWRRFTGRSYLDGGWHEAEK